MNTTINKILIIVEGGVVQSIYSSDLNLKYEILDFDNEELASFVDEENLLNSKIEGLEAVL